MAILSGLKFFCVILLLSVLYRKINSEEYVKHYCPFFDNRNPTPQPGLKNCTWYKSNSCCTQNEIDITFDTIKPFTGASKTCQKYLNYLACYICAPHQNEFYYHDQLTLCQDFCDQLFEACGTASMKGYQIKDKYLTARAFCENRRYKISTGIGCFSSAHIQHLNSASKRMDNSTRILMLILILCSTWQYFECFIFSVFQYFLFPNPKSLKKNALTKVVAALLFLSHVQKASSTQITLSEENVKAWTEAIAKNMYDFSYDVLGVKIAQDSFDSSEHTFEVVNGTRALMDLRDELSIFFSKRDDLVSRLADKAQIAFSNNESISEFENLNSLPSYMYLDADDVFDELCASFDRKYKANVCFNQSSVKLPSNVDFDDVNIINDIIQSAELDEVFKDNRNIDSTIRWQYFGSISGMHRQYPGKEFSRNFIGMSEEYDPRIRPWYLGVTSAPKDVVIILDVSSSMESDNRLQRLQSIAKHILLTLTKLDRVNIVLSRSSYWTPTGTLVDKSSRVLGCAEDVLIPATSSNIRELLSRLKTVTADGGSDHLPAFEKAFSLLNEVDTAKNEYCQSVVIFITDGEPQDAYGIRCSEGYTKYREDNTREYISGRICSYEYDDIPKDIQGLQRRMGHKANIFTFLVDDSSQSSHEYLTEIACDNNGIAIKVTTDEDELEQMEPYFEYLRASADMLTPQWTSAYLDESGLGLMMTVSQSVYLNQTDQHLGVVGIDVPLEEVEKILRRAAWGETYAFLVDRNDLSAVIHPFVKPPVELSEDPIFVPIYELETHHGKPTEFQEVMDGIVNGKTGSVTIETDAMRVVSTHELLSWKPVTKMQYVFTSIPGTDLAVVFNIGENDQRFIRIKHPPAPRDDDTLYLDDMDQYRALADEIPGAYEELDPTRSDSRYRGVSVSTEHAVVKLAPEAFCHPGRYVTQDEPSLREIHEYLNDYSREFDVDCPEGTFVPGVKSDVQLTSDLEDFWLSRDEEIESDITWTYLGLRSGIMRIYPGVHMRDNYNPTVRDWYHRTEANNPLQMTLSSVYQDSNPYIGNVVTLSKAIRTPDPQNPKRHLIHTPGESCPAKMFDCESGECIQQRRVCDGHSDCRNGRDENTTGCEQGSWGVTDFMLVSGQEGKLCVEYWGTFGLPDIGYHTLSVQIWTRHGCDGWAKSEGVPFSGETTPHSSYCVPPPPSKSYSYKVILFANDTAGATKLPKFVNPEQAEKLDIGCRCKTDIQCGSGACELGQCVTNGIYGVLAADIRYDSFLEHIYDVGEEHKFHKFCGAHYKCEGGVRCITKCLIVTDTAHIVLDEDIEGDSEESHGDVTLASKQGFIFSELVKKGVFVKQVRRDYQAVCQITKSKPRTKVVIETLKNESLTYSKYYDPFMYSFDTEQGPIKPFNNDYSCIKEVIYYTVNEDAITKNRYSQYYNAPNRHTLTDEHVILTGSLADDPCAASGRYFFVRLPGFNAFLLVLEDYWPKKTPGNFNCEIRNSVLAPGSFEIEEDMCTERKPLPVLGRRICPVQQETSLPCGYSQAMHLRIQYVYVFIMTSLISLIILI